MKNEFYEKIINSPFNYSVCKDCSFLTGNLNTLECVLPFPIEEREINYFNSKECCYQHEYK
jgi:hypothetical protein